MAVSAFQLLGNTLSVDQSLSGVSVAIRDQTLRSYQWTCVVKQATSALVGWEHIHMIQNQFSEHIVLRHFPLLELTTPEKTCNLMIFLSQAYLYACPKLRYARNRSRTACFNERFLKQAILSSKKLAENAVDVHLISNQLYELQFCFSKPRTDHVQPRLT
jgi:hypothetical protein